MGSGTTERISSSPTGFFLVEAVQDGEDLQTPTLHHFTSKDLRQEVLKLIELDLQAVGLVGCCNHQLLEVADTRALSRCCGEARRIHCVKCSNIEQKVITYNGVRGLI